jgi:hypothetical protein
LQARAIEVLVYDDPMPARYYSIDFIHWSREGHTAVAHTLLPQVLAVIGHARGNGVRGARKP